MFCKGIGGLARYDIKANSNALNKDGLMILFNSKSMKGLCPKLQRNWDGPYKVVKRINGAALSVAYIITWTLPKEHKHFYVS